MNTSFGYSKERIDVHELLLQLSLKTTIIPNKCMECNIEGDLDSESISNICIGILRDFPRNILACPSPKNSKSIIIGFKPATDLKQWIPTIQKFLLKFGYKSTLADSDFEIHDELLISSFFAYVLQSYFLNNGWICFSPPDTEGSKALALPLIDTQHSKSKIGLVYDVIKIDNCTISNLDKFVGPVQEAIIANVKVLYSCYHVVKSTPEFNVSHLHEGK